MRRLGSQIIRHSFRQENKVAHVLAKEGSKQAMSEYLSVMATSPETVLTIVQADNRGLATNIIVLVSMCNKFASHGNLCVPTIYDSEQVVNSSTVTL